MRGSLYSGSHTLSSPASAFAGIFGNLTHNLCHAFVARFLH